MDRTVLRSINVNRCDMCVVLSAKSPGGNQALMDKYAILCYLNIKSMKFGPGCDADQSDATVADSNASAQVTITGTRTPASLRRGLTQRNHSSNLQRMVSAVPKIANSIPVITEIGKSAFFVRFFKQYCFCEVSLEILTKYINPRPMLRSI